VANPVVLLLYQMKLGLYFMNSASARISKGQGYQGFLRKREQFWPKKGNLRRTRKTGQNFTPFRVNKMFSLKF
jgi:hypothetical protein